MSEASVTKRPPLDVKNNLLHDARGPPCPTTIGPIRPIIFDALEDAFGSAPDISLPNDANAEDGAKGSLGASLLKKGAPDATATADDNSEMDSAQLIQRRSGVEGILARQRIPHAQHMAAQGHDTHGV